MTTPTPRPTPPHAPATAVGFPSAAFSGADYSGVERARGDHLSFDDLRSRIAPPERLPERIGGYRIVGVLGEGGMGVVYQAVQLSLERMVALKVVRGDLARKEAFVGRFLREAKVAARIDHPNVVTIYDTGEADGHLYMALQYVLGGDLGTRIKGQGGRTDEDEALRIIAGCAKGLMAIHAAGLVHRDIKPSNIFLTPEGTPKIGDLGLARNIIDDEKLTFTGHLVGTPSYMAPEQAKGAQDIDHRADIYSLGTSFYHLLTGRPPFHGSSPFLIGHQVIAEVPQDPRELNRAMSPAVAAIIHHAMHKDRACRYQSAEELLVDVELVRSGKLPRFARVTVMDEERRATRLGSLATAPPPGMDGGEQARSFIPVAVAAGMLVGIAVALAVGLGLAQRNAEPPPPPLPTAALPRPAQATRSAFPPSRELPPMIQEEVPSVEFLAANEPAERLVAAQPSRTVRPAPPARPAPAPPLVAAAAPAPTPVDRPAAVPAVPEPPPAVAVSPAAAVELPPPDIVIEPPIPTTVDAHQALRVVREEVVRVPLSGATTTPDPAPSVPPRNHLGPTVPVPAPAVRAPAPAPAPALIEQPIDAALQPPAVVEAHVPGVDSAPRWASAVGADRYGAWADLTIGTAVQRFRLCPAGGALIGSPEGEAGRANDETLHRVTIEQPYWLADSECTQLVWRTLMGDNPSSTQGDQLPVDQVSFQRVQDFLRRANEQRPGIGLRLPSEMEWEAACRAGSRGPYSGGIDLRSLAWYRATAGDRLAAVAGRLPNAYGLFDIHGNVWEWCQGAHRGYPPDRDGLAIATHAFVFRGGGFADTAEDCRAARRGGNQTGDGFTGVGFRLAASATLR